MLLDALADVDANATRPIDHALAAVELPAARNAIVVAVSGSDDWRPGGPGKTIPFPCRRFVIVSPKNLDDVYEDDPLAVAEGSPCP